MSFFDGPERWLRHLRTEIGTRSALRTARKKGSKQSTDNKMVSKVKNAVRSIRDFFAGFLPEPSFAYAAA
jgi:hypothetical protein